MHSVVIGPGLGRDQRLLTVVKVGGYWHFFFSFSGFFRPPGTLVPKAFCFSRDVYFFLLASGPPSSLGRSPRNFTT